MGSAGRLGFLQHSLSPQTLYDVIITGKMRVFCLLNKRLKFEKIGKYALGSYHVISKLQILLEGVTKITKFLRNLILNSKFLLDCHEYYTIYLRFYVYSSLCKP